MKVLNDMPEGHDEDRRARRRVRQEWDGLRLPQVRVLKVLYDAKGAALTRTKISERVGTKTPVMLTRAIGYSDPEKRAAFEETKDGGGTPGNPCQSLLTLGYVREIRLDIDGLIETSIELTPKGRLAYEALGEVHLPPLRD